MAAYHEDDELDPYRAYQPSSFDTVNLSAPVRGQGPPTSTFDRPPMRGAAPYPASDPPTSDFSGPPVRGSAAFSTAPSPPTSVYNDPPLRGAAQPARAAVPAAMNRQFDEPAPARGVPPVRTAADPVPSPVQQKLPERTGRNPIEAGGWGGGGGESPIGSGQTPVMQGKGKKGKGKQMPPAMVVTNVVLRSLACVCLIIGLALLVRFVSDVNKYSNLPNSPSTYAMGVVIIGIIYSAFELICAVFRLVMGRQLVPPLVSYIGDQVLMVLLLSAGTAVSAYLITLTCHDSTICGRGAGGAAMACIAFGILAASSVISAFCFYKKKT